VRVEAEVTGAALKSALPAATERPAQLACRYLPLQVLVVDENQIPLPGVPVTFTITSGGGSLSARIVITDTSESPM